MVKVMEIMQTCLIVIYPASLGMTVGSPGRCELQTRGEGEVCPSCSERGDPFRTPPGLAGTSPPLGVRQAGGGASRVLSIPLEVRLLNKDRAQDNKSPSDLSLLSVPVPFHYTITL